MKLTSLLLVSGLLATNVTAQTQLLRGKVEDVRNTQNRFFLDCTNIPLTSSKLNLNTMVGQQFEQHRDDEDLRHGQHPAGPV